MSRKSASCNQSINQSCSSRCTQLKVVQLYSERWVHLKPILQLLKNFPAFYGNRRFMTVFTRALHWSLSWARSIQSIPSRPISLKPILILSTHLCLGRPSALFFYIHPLLFAHWVKIFRCLAVNPVEQFAYVRWNAIALIQNTNFKHTISIDRNSTESVVWFLVARNKVVLWRYTISLLHDT
jgi:hypothetical protein